MKISLLEPDELGTASATDSILSIESEPDGVRIERYPLGCGADRIWGALSPARSYLIEHQLLRIVILEPVAELLPIPWNDEPRRLVARMQLAHLLQRLQTWI